MQYLRSALTLLALVGTGAAQGNPVTYTEHIAPLIMKHCAACHQRDGIAPFSLLDYTLARKHARLISEVVADRYMPPWKPDAAGSPPLRDDRRLTDADIALFQAWYAQGMPPGGVIRPEASPPPAQEWVLGPPDLILELPEAYTLPATGKDVYHNFVIPIPLAVRRYVRAVEFRPEVRGVIHHATFALDPTPASRRRDAADPGPGFNSMDLGRAVNPNGHIIGWTPGQVPYEVFPGTAWELKPDTDLLLQLHLLPSGKPEAIRPRIGLYFTATPPVLTSTVIQLRAYEIDIPAGATNHVIEQQFTLPINARIIGLYPHAHYLGRDLQIFADLPNGTRRSLLRIPDWDFNWQSDYRYVTPLPLPAGARITMRYTYDNSAANPRNPSKPPIRVQAGWSSSDEMGEVAIQLLLNTPAERLQLDEAQARYDLATGAATAANWYNLAVSLDYQGRGAEAVPHYEKTIALDPAMPPALNNLAALTERNGDPFRAATLYRRALAADPHLTEARFNLARLLARQHQAGEARPLLEEILRTHPDHLRARLTLADLLVAQNDLPAALTLLNAGLPWHPAEPELQLRLGKIHALAGRPAEAQVHLTSAAIGTVRREEQPDLTLTAATRAEAGYTLAILAQQAGNVPAMTEALDLALTAQPDHAAALLMSATLSVARGHNAEALRHLKALLRSAAASRPSNQEILAVLPYPAGPALLAQALAANGETVAARQILAEGREQALKTGQPELAVQFENLARRLSIP